MAAEEAHARTQEEATLEQAIHMSEEEAHARTLEEAILEQAIQQIEPGACLDKQTPRDGHCLFHALLRGGLGTLSAHNQAQTLSIGLFAL